MIDREELERLHEAATPGSWHVDGGPCNQIIWRDDVNRICFMAHSDGRDEARDIATASIITYLRNAVPDILGLLTERDTLAAENAALTAKVERLMNSLEPFAQLSRRKANFVIRPDDPILLEAVRALEN